jgi:hypothetical protein
VTSRHNLWIADFLPWFSWAKIKNVRRVGDPIRYCLANKC